MKKIATFDDWIDAFYAWRKDIDLRLPPKFADYPFEAKYGEIKSNEIEYGDFRGARKWERVTQIPHQPIRDALLNLIVYQGDTEFASVEQQRNLLETSPSEYDTESICRIMLEEMRHGWQMCHLLVTPLRGDREGRSPQAARAPLLGEQPAARLFQRQGGQLGGLLRVHRVRGPGREVPAQHALHLRLRAARAVHGTDAARGGFPSRHRTHGPAAHRQGGRAAGSGPPEVHQQVALDGLRPVRQGLLLIRRVVLRLGSEGTVRRGAAGQRSGQGPLERALPRDVPAGSREAGPVHQPPHPGGRSAALRAEPQVPSRHR